MNIEPMITGNPFLDQILDNLLTYIERPRPPDAASGEPHLPY